MLFPLLISVVRWKEDFVVGHLQILIFKNVKNEHSVEKFLWLTLSFWTGVSSLLTVEKASCLALVSGRREPQFHLQFPFQIFLCFTLVQMGTYKKPQEPVCDECKWGWKEARMRENHSGLQLHVHQRIPAWRLSHIPLCLHTVPLSPLKPIPKPMPAAGLGPALRKSHCWERKENSMNDSVFGNQGEM